MSCGIYKITNPNNRIYIGQSKNIVNRWNQHKYQYGKNNIILSRSILKYGYEKHKFEIIENCSVDELNQKEIYWINYYKSNYKLYPENNGLNLSDGGDKPPLNDMPLKEKTKLLISEKNSLRHCEKRISNIKQFDKLGNLIKIWKNYEFNKNSYFKYYKVIKCCNGVYKTYGNFIWRFFEDDFLKHIVLKKIEKIKKQKNKISDITRKKMSNSQIKLWNNERKLKYSKLFKGRSNYWKKGKQNENYIKKRIDKIKKPVLQYDLEDNFIKEWQSLKQIEEELKYCSDYISLVAKGKKIKYKNFKWKFKN